MDQRGSDVNGGILDYFVGIFMMYVLGSLEGRRHELFVLLHVDQEKQVTT